MCYFNQKTFFSKNDEQNMKIMKNQSEGGKSNEPVYNGAGVRGRLAPGSMRSQYFVLLLYLPRASHKNSHTTEQRAMNNLGGSRGYEAPYSKIGHHLFCALLF